MIENYLRDIGMEMLTIKINGEKVNVSDEKIMIYLLLSTYIRSKIE
jgi:hypothetical protein